MLEDHGAAGAAAGYFFQLERAVVRLSIPGAGKLVGIETLDDIAEVDEQRLALEQDKHALSGRQPYADRSVDLWKTLATWMRAIVVGEVSPGATEFVLVTNRILPVGTLARDMVGAQSPEQVAAAVARVRAEAADLPSALHKYRDAIVACDDTEIGGLIRQLRLIDGSEASDFPAEMKQRVCNNVYLENAPAEEVFDALVGWVHGQCLAKWRAKEPAWIPWEAFAAQVNRLRAIYRSDVILRAAADVPVDLTMESIGEDRLFLKQLRILDLNDDELLSDAVADFLRARTEMVRISNDGYITKADHTDFLERLQRRWVNFHRRHRAGLNRDQSAYPVQACRAGTAVLTDCMEVLEPLAGSPVDQRYFICGHYHHLADLPLVGWHPDFKTLLAPRK